MHSFLKLFIRCSSLQRSSSAFLEERPPFLILGTLIIKEKELSLFNSRVALLAY